MSYYYTLYYHTEKMVINQPNFVITDGLSELNNLEDNNLDLSQVLSAFEVSTKTALKDVNEAKQKYQVCPNVLCITHSNWLVLTVGSEIHVFDLAMGCSEIQHKCWKKTDTIVAVQYLPTSDVFMALLNNGEAVFISTTNCIESTKQLTMPIEDCSMQIAITHQKTFTACILDRTNSTLYLATIPELDVSIRSEDAFHAQFSVVQLEHKLSIGSLQSHFVATVANSFVFFPKNKGELVTSIALHPEDFEEPEEMFVLRQSLRMVKTVGCFVVAVDFEGKLIIFDQKLVVIKVITLFQPHEQREEVLDFVFLDVDNFHEFTADVKILLKVKTDAGVKFKIRQFNQSEIQFTTKCSEHALLIPSTTLDFDNNILYVDAFPSNNPAIFIRYVSEANPMARLERLLEMKYFDNALNFAKSHNLSLDLIYAAIVRYYQKQIESAENGAYEEEKFNEMMRSLRQLSDNNIAADLCIVALAFVNQYEHIKTILNLAKDLKITEEDTSAEIVRIRYELGTYRMVYGSDAQYGRDSEWQAFSSSDTHKDFFDRFCGMSKIAEARILFTRYVDITKELTKREEIQKLLSQFQRIITEDPTRCKAVSEFVESDLIALFLYSRCDFKEICANICNFFINTSLLLEQLEPKQFPQNALSFAQTFSRAIELLKKQSNTTDQYVGVLYILKQLDDEEEPQKAASPIVQLKNLVRNLTKLVKLHTVYQCTMNYAEFLTHDVHSICCHILDKVRAAYSVREHIEHFVFPYIEEHKLDRNEMLVIYIKNLANASHGAVPHHDSNTWEQLCLQITEQITDVNMRCQAIIDITSGAMLPWNQQLANIVQGIMAQGERIDPQLIAKLRKQCLYADIGQLFISYNIPLDVRSRVFNPTALLSLLQFIFKNGDNEMSVKLQDGFKIIGLYEKLHSTPLLSSVDLYYAYAMVLVQQFPDEWEIKPLLDLFQLIKSQEEVKAVASKFVCLMRNFIQPTTVKKVLSRRPIWLACLLAVQERYMPNNAKNIASINRARRIRKLEQGHQIVVGFDTFRNKAECLRILENYIETPNQKSIVEVVCFGELLEIPLKDTCAALMAAQFKNGFPEAVLRTLSFMLSNENVLKKAHLELALEACTKICWKFTKMVEDAREIDAKIDFFKSTIKMFKLILPKLADCSVEMGEMSFADSFLKISRYFSLFSIILDVIDIKIDPTTSSSEKSIENGKNSSEILNKFYTTKPRLGVMLPQHEGRLFDAAPVVNTISMVASSTIEPLIEIEHRDKFNEQMHDTWNQLLISLSRSHVFLEIQARQFANTLPCFNSNGKVETKALVGLDSQVAELCTQILVLPIADLQLAVHLLCSLSKAEMLKTLQALRRWAASKKNVRCTLNLIRVSLFVLMLSKDMQNFKSVAVWYEQTQWQKRFFKHGISLEGAQLKQETFNALLPEFAKVLLPSALLKEYCVGTNINMPSLLLNYAVELCKFSSSIASSDQQRFVLCIEEAKTALQNANASEGNILILSQAIQEICPYNYEAIQLLLTKQGQFLAAGVLSEENQSQIARIKDSITLMSFLKLYKRQAKISTAEVRWYKSFVNPKYYEISTLTNISAQADDTIAIGETSMLGSQNLPMPLYSRQDTLMQEPESHLPKMAKTHLPFHLLLLDQKQKESIEKHQMPFIQQEINIFNINLWITLVECTTTILRQRSRSNMIVGTIGTYVNEAVKFKRELNDDELKLINKIIYESHSKLVILKSLCSKFQRHALGPTKLSLIELCCQVVEKWLANYDELQIPDSDREAYEQCQLTFRRLLDVLNTEHLLHANELLDTDTATLTQKPGELINHLLCSAKIDWTDAAFVDKYFRIVEEVSRIHRVELEQIFHNLIDYWICGNEFADGAQQGISSIAATNDPDCTIDFLGGTANSNTKMFVGKTVDDAEFMLPMLYDDPQTTRIIALMKRINEPNEKIDEFSRKTKLEISILPGGYMTKVRIASCILRFLDNDQMKQLLGLDINQFCCTVITLLNQRLYSICRIEMPAQELQEKTSTRLELVRSILSRHSIYRMTPEIGHLLVCTVIDNEIDDPKLLRDTAQCLLQLRLPRHLMGLLKYLRTIQQNVDIKAIPGLATYFGSAFETIFTQLDLEKDDVHELHSLVHFLIGCPVEGKAHFLRAQNQLSSIHANVASALVAIAADAIADVCSGQQKKKEETGGASSSHDIKLSRSL